MTKFGDSLRPFLLLIIRLYWGYQLTVIGFDKWRHIDNVIANFNSLNIFLPTLSAYLVASLELVGGLALFLGFLSRFFAFLLTLLFIMAYFLAHNKAVMQLFHNPKLFLDQAPFLFLYASLIIFCVGPGFFSIDQWCITKKKN